MKGPSGWAAEYLQQWEGWEGWEETFVHGKIRASPYTWQGQKRRRRTNTFYLPGASQGLI
jgi:hypothetical protein